MASTGHEISLLPTYPVWLGRSIGPKGTLGLTAGFWAAADQLPQPTALVVMARLIISQSDLPCGVHFCFPFAQWQPQELAPRTALCTPGGHGWIASKGRFAERVRETVMNRRQFVTKVTGSGLLVATAFLSGCSTTGSGASSDNAAKRREIDSGVDGALNRLFASVNGSRELAQRAHGVLVFPRVIAGGFIVGGEYGEGALRTHGATVGYYSTAHASFGLTAGGQSKSEIIMFMTSEAYEKFVKSSGWTAGADANVAIAKVGANGQLDTLTSQQPVVGFVQTNAGLMFDVSMNGAKISKLNL